MGVTSEDKVRVCDLCGRSSSEVSLIPFGLVREPVVHLIEEKYPDRPHDGFICAEDLNDLRVEYVGTLLSVEKGELSVLEKEVLESIREQDTLSSQVENEFQSSLTFGERLSDKIASFGGSWIFIILFASVFSIWMVINSSPFTSHPFDPYPFILLNLALSGIAAIQAPVIMMSQNRQEDRDRLRAIRDYQVNLKAELEIRHLNHKIDHMLSSQWERLMEIQRIQIDLIHEIEGRRVLTGSTARPRTEPQNG